jgi:mersacidin/lichenicidin family type 2 lantibiotic
MRALSRLLREKSLQIKNKKNKTKEEVCMCKFDVVRAWKDEDYRMSLSDAERRMLPTNPAGLIEISDSELGAVAGGEAGGGGGSFGFFCSLLGPCYSELNVMCTGCILPCGGTAGPFFCPIFD